MTIKNLKDLCKILNITWEEFGNLNWWIRPKNGAERGEVILLIEVHSEEWAYRLKTNKTSNIRAFGTSKTYWEKIG